MIATRQIPALQTIANNAFLFILCEYKFNVEYFS